MSVKKTISLFFDDLTKNIVDRANQKDQNVSNKIPKSFSQNINVSGDTINATLSAWKWTIAAWETGRGKTVNKGKGELRPAIERWLRRKGIQPKGMNKDIDKAYKSLSFVIARKIHKEGTNLWNSRDDRFSGNRSMTISDFINKKTTSNFAKSLASTIVQTEITPLLNFRDK